MTVDNPQRVVACMGSFASIWELAGGTLVGASDDAFTLSDYDLKSENVQKVGDFSNPNLESIIALEPDFVIMTSGSGGRGGDSNQADLKAAETAVGQAQTALDKAQADKTQADERVSILTDAENALAQAQSAYDEAKSEADQARQALEAAKADLDAKQDAYAQAKAKSDEAARQVKDLEAALADLDAKTQALTAAQKDLDAKTQPTSRLPRPATTPPSRSRPPRPR